METSEQGPGLPDSPKSWYAAHEKELGAAYLEDAPDWVSTKTGLVRVGFDDELTNGEQSKGKQTLGYCVGRPNNYQVEPRLHDAPVIIRFGQWTEHADRDFDQNRTTAVAAATGYLTIAVDTPGQSHNSRVLTPRQKEAMKTGDFNPVTAAQWNAAKEVLKTEGITLDNAECILTGSSQGATLVASAAQTAPENVEMSAAVLWNTPSFSTPEERGPGGFFRDFAIHGGENDKVYKENNPDWVSEDPLSRLAPQLAGMPRGHWLAVRGMVRAQDHTKLPEALGADDGRNRRLAPVLFKLIHGTQDRVSTVQQNERAADKLMRGGFGNVTRQELTGEYHAITNNMRAFGFVIQQAIKDR